MYVFAECNASPSKTNYFVSYSYVFQNVKIRKIA